MAIALCPSSKQEGWTKPDHTEDPVYVFGGGGWAWTPSGLLSDIHLKGQQWGKGMTMPAVSVQTLWWTWPTAA